MNILRKNRPVRSFAGKKWTTDKTNKKYLKKDFNERCGYCDDPIFLNVGYYHIDHFAPKEKFPKLRYVYDNLVYACPYCNGAKSDTWVSDSADISVVDDKGFIDPCSVEYDNHLERKKSGEIAYKTELGKFMHRNLNLGLKRHQVLYSLEEINSKIDEIRKIIDKKKESGDDVASLESLYTSSLEKFREYTLRLRE